MHRGSVCSDLSMWWNAIFRKMCVLFKTFVLKTLHFISVQLNFFGRREEFLWPSPLNSLVLGSCLQMKDSTQRKTRQSLFQHTIVNPFGPRLNDSPMTFAQEEDNCCKGSPRKNEMKVQRKGLCKRAAQRGKKETNCKILKSRNNFWSSRFDFWIFEDAGKRCPVTPRPASIGRFVCNIRAPGTKMAPARRRNPGGRY